MRARLRLAVCTLLCATSLQASETITYTYDARGRLIQVDHAGSVNDSVNACYAYDQTDNRSNVTVATSDCGSSPAVSFSISDAGAAEGSPLTFTVTKNGTATGSHSVSYATANATAVAGSDYTSAANSLTFLATDTQKSFAVATINDSAVEAEETLSVTLSAPTGGAVVADAHGIGTIAASDSPLPTFSINDTSVTEGGDLVFTVTKSSPSPTSNTLYWATANGSAFAGSDFLYQDIEVALTFGPAELTKTITIPTIDDTAVEGAHAMAVNLTGASFTDAQGIGTILDDDVSTACAGVSFTVVSNGPVQEGTGSAFTITKSGSTTSSCSVDYATSNGSAIAPGDYTAKSGTLGFSSTMTSQGVIVTTIDDSTTESSETLTLTLSNPGDSAALGTPASATATITDDDGPTACAGVTFTIASQGAVTEGANSYFTVTKTGTTTASCSVSYATSNGTAVAPGDYTSGSGSLTFAPGSGGTAITVPTINDSTVESAETFAVALSGPEKGATLGSPSSAAATINDNDGAPPAGFSVNDGSAIEGGIVTFTVSRTSGTGTASVSYATATGTAASNDFTAKSGSLSFSSGQTSKTVTVQTTQDIRIEDTEVFYLDLSNASGAAIVDGQGAGSIIDDGDGEPCPTCLVQSTPESTVSEESAQEDSAPETTVPEESATEESEPESGPGGAI